MRMRAWIFTLAFSFSLISFAAPKPVPKPATPPQFLEVTLRAMLFPVKTNASEFTLVIYNEEMKRATYVVIRKKSDGEWAGSLKIPPESKKYISHWRIGVPSSSDQRYFSFLYHLVDETHLNIDLDVDLVTRGEIQRVDFHKKNAQTF